MSTAIIPPPMALLTKIILLFILVTVSSKTVPRRKLPESLLLESNHPLRLELLGTADGKSYYADSEMSLTWINAYHYCQTFDMDLATIETENQWNLLVEATSDVIATSHFWVGARESRLPSMYIWNDTETAIDMTAIKNWNDAYFGISRCVAFYAYANNSSRTALYPYSCSNNGKVMCQGELNPCKT